MCIWQSCSHLNPPTVRQVSEIFRTPWLLSESSAAPPQSLHHGSRKAVSAFLSHAAQLPRNTRFIKAVQLTVESLHTHSNNIRSHLLTALSIQAAEAAGTALSMSDWVVLICMCSRGGPGGGAPAQFVCVSRIVPAVDRHGQGEAAGHFERSPSRAVPESGQGNTPCICV